MNSETQDYYEDLVNKIRSFLTEKEMTQKDLAWRMQMSPVQLSRFLNRYSGSENDLLRIETQFHHAIVSLESEAKRKAPSKGNHVFISYSHRDKKYLDRLIIHLKPLEKKGIIDAWVDTRLLAGDKWKKEIESALKNARVAILMVSADFLASDFIIENELPPLLRKAEQAGSLIIPVILRPCRFARDEALREFQAINPPNEPLSLLDENEQELIYDSIAQRVEDIFGYGV